MIYTVTIADAHSRVCREVLTYGDTVITEDGKSTLELDYPLAVCILEPFTEPMIHRANPFTHMEDYAKQLITISESGHTYTYGNRLRDYPFNLDGFEMGNGHGDGTDQITIIIDMIKKNPSTRRAIAHTWSIEDDLGEKEVPCLQTIQFTIRGGKLNVTAYFRSNDMCLAWGANAYGLAKLMEYIVTELDSDVTVGALTTVSQCAHIYDTDLAVAGRIANG